MLSAFDSILGNLEKLAPQRITTTYKSVATPSAPLTSLISAPIPFSIKADLNAKKGEITSWLAMYKDPQTGRNYKDSYNDFCEPGFMDASIQQLKVNRTRTNQPYLMLYLWQHDRHEIIGGVKELIPDSQGVMYIAKINMQVQRGREAFALAEAKQIGGSSYGYDAKKYFYDTAENRHLVEVDIRECSLVSFPANPHAQVLDAKSKHYVPSGYGKIEQLTTQMRTHFAALENQMKSMHSDFPRLSNDDYVGEGEQSITDLLTSIQQSLRKD